MISKKGFLPLTLWSGFGILCACLAGGAILKWNVSRYRDDQNDCSKYLSQRYQAEFIMIGEITPEDHNIKSAYQVFPEDNCDLVFQVTRIETTQQVFPFLPPIKYTSFRDDFRERIKDYVVMRRGEILKVNNEKDIQVCTRQIINLMEEVQALYQVYQIPATNYSCGLELEVNINGNGEVLNLYQKEERVIQDILMKSLQNNLFQ